FAENNWPAFHFFDDNSGAAHMFARLPVKDAIRWLEAQSAEDPAKLLEFAEKSVKGGAFRDAIAAATRAANLKLDPAAKARLERPTKEPDHKAAAGEKQFPPKIKANQSSGWIDSFLDFRDQFKFAPAAKETMEAFNLLRARHEPDAVKAMNQARAAF